MNPGSGGLLTATQIFDFCLAYPIRLAGSSVPHAGILQIKVNGTWGTVCQRGGSFDTKSQIVACRQLGFGMALRSVYVVNG